MATSKVLKPRRGSTAEHATFKGQAFEITFDTDKKTLVMHDGLTMGGFPLAHETAVAETDNALRILIDQKVSEVEGVSSNELQALDSALRGLINNQAQQQASRDANQDNVIATLDSTLRTLIAAELEKKLSLSGGTLTGWLRFAYGRISSSTDVKALEFRAFIDEYNGASLVLKNLSAEAYPGEAIIQARASDGTPGENIRFLADGSIVIADAKVLTDAQGLPVSTGIVVPFAANTVPDGFLLCNGAAVSRATYAKLFNVIGTTYGTGDGSSTFNLPNLTDKFIQGSGTAGTVKAAGLPEIAGNHGRSASTFASNPFFFDDSGAVSGGLSGTGGTGRIIGFKASLANAIYGASNTVQPPALTMRYCIKY